MENKNKIEHYYKKNRFKDILLSTKIYKELYNSKEAFFSFAFSIISIIILYLLVFSFPTKEISENLIDLIGIIIGSLIGLLGFLIGGLALIVGSIGDKIIKKINEEEKFDTLLRIIFRFYFVGSLLGFSVIISLITYLILLFPLEFNVIMVVLFTFFVSYFFCYSLLASVMLMGTCIRLMILNYFYNQKKTK